ncbi:uncharacterized protein LOC143179429 [Calliopsis andreniformis]|uniref:uncharacterized protein LOC143179429 n=1 Tax=Calliopsis andreniformis TaxID=337506 RepID=UPI003FCCF0FF
MRKLFVFLLVALVAASFVMGCKPPGLLCTQDKDCCAPLICNPWAGRCTKQLAPPAPGQPGGAAGSPPDGQ